eukprot:Sspe_Gene.102034::Locus_76736_Transcript_1_1_Confidence_1.000_Length_743::g.102034::m.102034
MFNETMTKKVLELVAKYKACRRELSVIAEGMERRRSAELRSDLPAYISESLTGGAWRSAPSFYRAAAAQALLYPDGECKQRWYVRVHGPRFSPYYMSSPTFVLNFDSVTSAAPPTVECRGLRGVDCSTLSSLVDSAVKAMRGPFTTDAERSIRVQYEKERHLFKTRLKMNEAYVCLRLRGLASETLSDFVAPYLLAPLPAPIGLCFVHVLP